MMRCLAVTSLFMAALAAVALPQDVHAASQAEAREVARLNNCLPKKIAVFSQTLGADGTTVYRVDCAMPDMKAEEGKAKPPDALLIKCSGSLCNLMRPLQSSADK